MGKQRNAGCAAGVVLDSTVSHTHCQVKVLLNGSGFTFAALLALGFLIRRITRLLTPTYTDQHKNTHSVTHAHKCEMKAG